MPTATPTKTQMITAPNVSEIVAGRRSKIWLLTFWLFW